MVSVRFASSQYFDTERGLILFSAFANHELIRCAIAVRTLVEQFDADPQFPMRAFARHRNRIERLAEELIVERRLEQDGSILIFPSDCGWLRDTSHQPIGAHPVVAI
jgi:hypothetical protein